MSYLKRKDRRTGTNLAHKIDYLVNNYFFHIVTVATSVAP